MPKKLKPVTFPQHLGAAINSAMTARGVTQEETAEAVGMTEQTFGRRIRGQYPLLVSELIFIARFLGVTPQSIIDAALEKYGGIEKLVSEGTSTKVEPPSGEKSHYDKAAQNRDEESDQDEQYA